jgi:hypothetical protein
MCLRFTGGMYGYIVCGVFHLLVMDMEAQLIPLAS